VRPAPAARRYEGWSFASFAEGVEAFRALAQAGVAPDVARLSDEEESRLSAALAATGSRLERAGRAYLRARGHGAGAIAILGYEGERRDLARRRTRAARLLRSAGALSLGGRPGRAWERSRYAAPYLRDELLDLGVLAETLETATTWSGLLDLHRAVGEALASALAAGGTRPLVGCHLSHLYESGASLYFTVLARAEPGEELDQWRAAKRAASEAIVARGATITHHHGIGADHRPWLEAEIGGLGAGVLRAAKERLDPAGIMNPGKLLP
jgi:alkyldihydroxyacetonephosphate synthase